VTDRRLRDVLLLALTLNAGAIDALSYLGLHRVFTANMTGNMVLLALSAGQGQEFGAIRSATAFVGYAIGAFAGARIVGRSRSAEVWAPRVTTALAAELLLLVALALGWQASAAQPVRPVLELLIGFSAAAMGLQSAAAARLAVTGITTTYVTGTLTGLMSELAALAGRSSWGLRAGVITALAVGAGINALVLRYWPPGAALVPVAVLVGATLTALRYFRS